MIGSVMKMENIHYTRGNNMKKETMIASFIEGIALNSVMKSFGIEFFSKNWIIIFLVVGSILAIINVTIFREGDE